MVEENLLLSQNTSFTFITLKLFQELRKNVKFFNKNYFYCCKNSVNYKGFRSCGPWTMDKNKIEIPYYVTISQPYYVI